MDTVLWLRPSLPTEILKWLSSLPILMQESFWWWQCRDRYIISLSPQSMPPSPPSPVPNKPYGSVDVKHHVYLLTLLTPLSVSCPLTTPHHYSFFLNWILKKQRSRVEQKSVLSDWVRASPRRAIRWKNERLEWIRTPPDKEQKRRRGEGGVGTQHLVELLDTYCSTHLTSQQACSTPGPLRM